MPISKNRISLKEASELTGYHPDYLSQLIRKKKLIGERIGHTWFTTKEDVSAYLAGKKFVSAETAAASTMRYPFVLAGIYFVVIMAVFISIIFYIFHEGGGMDSYSVQNSSALNGPADSGAGTVFNTSQ